MIKRIKATVKELCTRHYWFSFFLAAITYNRFCNNEKINAVIKNFQGDSLDGKTRKNLIIRLVANRLTYQIAYEEYFLFGYSKLNDMGKREYLGDFERIKLLDQIGTPESKKIFDDKYQTYLHFKKYFGSIIFFTVLFITENTPSLDSM